MASKALEIGGPPAGEPARGRRTAGRTAAAGDARGFSLIELLVVMLIIGVLAAIAIPLFTSDSAKAKDAQAKELARTAETTAETIATENDGHYNQVSREELSHTDASIHIVPSGSEAFLSAASGGESEYSVTATATDGDELTISRGADGVITRTCRSPVTKKGCSEGESGSW